MDTKICVACKQEKILTEFYTHKRSPKGRTSRCKECKKAYLSQPEHLAKRSKWAKNQYDNNPAFRLMNILRVRVNMLLINKEKNKTNELIGCSPQEWVVYLEQQWDDKMNWDNYGEYWEVDHIQPLSKGGSFHYKNTQPLTVSENRSKGDKLSHTYNRT